MVQVIVGTLIEKGEKLRRPTGGRRRETVLGRTKIEVVGGDVSPKMVLPMEQRTYSKRGCTVDSDKGETSSKQHIMSKQEEGRGSYVLRRESRRRYAVDEGEDRATSSAREGRSMRHGKWVSNVPKVEVLWRYFEEANLMEELMPMLMIVLMCRWCLRQSWRMCPMLKQTRAVGGRRLCPGNRGGGGGRLQVMVQEHLLKDEKCGGGKVPIDRVVSLNEAISNVQKKAVTGMVLRPILKYSSFAMERNSALALAKLVPLSVFDYVLLTGLPATGERVQFDDDKVTTDFGDMRVHEEEQAELRKRKVGKGSRDNCVYKNFIAMMVYLCEKNAGEEQLELWLKLYTWLVLSGLLFPRAVYGATWELQWYVNDVHRMSRYAWAEARKLCNPISHIQFNGFSLLIQVCFYEHTTQFDAFEKRTFPQIVSWSDGYYRGWYDGFELVAGITENEIIPVMHLRAEEVEKPIVRDFIDVNDFRYYVEDGESRYGQSWVSHATHGRENMGTECGSLMAKSDSVAETDLVEDVGVCTEGMTIPPAGALQLADMQTKVGVDDDAASSVPGAKAVQGGDSSVLRAGGVNETALVVEERTCTAAVHTTLFQPAGTPAGEEQ
ncbi:LOW QUALITY PROTEIN: hypothetical protein Cgig2_030444 [Carnegiea gigantea]|uniref:Aminotransferase-like plant mobile domain-containing protein n=1 Tax=Carnegiea gigantea TaxID=171969 RepID=A0A9Q1KQT9_9CARY|nr:LOW QUALITY PROTEIN: hypothetical protein Cgig2_030444 [Carnegiea gigantea]